LVDEICEKNHENESQRQHGPPIAAYLDETAAPPRTRLLVYPRNTGAQRGVDRFDLLFGYQKSVASTGGLKDKKAFVSPYGAMDARPAYESPPLVE